MHFLEAELMNQRLCFQLVKEKRINAPCFFVSSAFLTFLVSKGTGVISERQHKLWDVSV